MYTTLPQISQKHKNIHILYAAGNSPRVIALRYEMPEPDVKRICLAVNKIIAAAIAINWAFGLETKILHILAANGIFTPDQFLQACLGDHPKICRFKGIGPKKFGQMWKFIKKHKDDRFKGMDITRPAKDLSWMDNMSPRLKGVLTRAKIDNVFDFVVATNDIIRGVGKKWKGCGPVTLLEARLQAARLSHP